MMMRLGSCTSAAVLLLLASGCAVPGAEPREPDLDLPPITMLAYEGPTPTIRVHPTGERPEIGRVVEVTLTARSGGHRLTLDHADVVDGEALIFLTVEQPAETEVVTMALETLRTEFETDRQFEVAKVHIRSHRRGEVPPASYRFAGDKRIDSVRGLSEP